MDSDRDSLVAKDSLASAEVFPTTPFGLADDSQGQIPDHESTSRHEDQLLMFRAEQRWTLPSESDVYIARLEKRLETLRSGKQPKRKGKDDFAVLPNEQSDAPPLTDPIENESLFAEFEHDDTVTSAPRNIFKRPPKDNACGCCCVS